MKKINKISVSNDLKLKVTKTTYAVVLFIIVYFTLLLFAIAITIASVYFGILLIISYPRLVILIIGFGLVSSSLLIFIFLIKFIFKRHKADYSHLIEIFRKDEPVFFKMLDKLSYKVDTTFPKKVFISPEVNASVFYDSSFWSMFFPIKKNLQIGMGLINTVSQEELKAILSHEFGHFSQKSMKSSSFVYNVNQIIFDMLFDNESFERLVEKWNEGGVYVSFFTSLAVLVTAGIQWVLEKMYGVVNKNFLALSREMEFHADEIAAHVTGYNPLKNALLRMPIAEKAFDSVLSFYNEKHEEGKASENIYEEQYFVMSFIAKEYGIISNNGFPLVTLDDLNKYNKSKLSIKDEWMSHPSVEERIERLERTNLKSNKKEIKPANELFSNIEEIQKRVTKKLFNIIYEQKSVEKLSIDSFKENFIINYQNKSFSRIYNGYYNDKKPVKFDIDDKNIIADEEINQLFSDKKVDLIYTIIGIQKDVEILDLIYKEEIIIDCFDYDGVKYKNDESLVLLKKLTLEIEKLTKEIQKNDLNIFIFFKQKEAEKKENKLLYLYDDLFKMDKELENKLAIYTDLITNLEFIQTTTELNDIKTNFEDNKKLEKILKNNIRGLLNDKFPLKESVRNKFELYLSKDWEYFGIQRYLDKNLELLFNVLEFYKQTLLNNYFLLKKELLDYQAELL